MLFAGLGVLVALALGVGAYVTRFTPAPSAPLLTSIAVLPFDDLSPDGDQEWLSGGIAEELIESLSRISELRIIARTSSRIAKASGADLSTIGEQLQVGAIVEGCVRRSGDQIGVTAQLIRVADASHFWSGRYDRTLDDVFAIQREIAGAVAEAIRAELGVAITHSSLARARYMPNDVRAWELLRRGTELSLTFHPKKMTQAGDLYAKAIAIDPNAIVIKACWNTGCGSTTGQVDHGATCNRHFHIDTHGTITIDTEGYGTVVFECRAIVEIHTDRMGNISTPGAHQEKTTHFRRTTNLRSVEGTVVKIDRTIGYIPNTIRIVIERTQFERGTT